MELFFVGGALLSTVAIVLTLFFLAARQKAEIQSLRYHLEQAFAHVVREEAYTTRQELAQGLSGTRSELSQALGASLQLYQDSQKTQLNVFAEQLSSQTQALDRNFHLVRQTMEQRLKDMQGDNREQLERMRETVDEKLHRTLEDRLTKSFSTVAERLERVQRGLGEMQSLAQGVGDLKKVLSNVKTKGMLGEMQLESIIRQILAPQQYGQNIATKKNSRYFVEFAIKLPGREGEGEVWVPVDAKFPTEDYHRLIQESDDGQVEAAARTRRQLYQSIKVFAKDIRDKYIDPPNTTDFAIMFLPTEGLYAEVIRDTDLFETLQREYKVTVTGPTTFSAFIYSLQMGFRSLAIEHHSTEVWKILAGVKTEFEKFALVLEKTKKKLHEAGNVIESAETRTRAMKRALKNVEALPEAASTELFPS